MKTKAEIVCENWTQSLAASVEPKLFCFTECGDFEEKQNVYFVVTF